MELVVFLLFFYDCIYFNFKYVHFGEITYMCILLPQNVHQFRHSVVGVLVNETLSLHRKCLENLPQ